MEKENQFIKFTSFLLLGTLVFLLIPFIGMQYSSEINWTISDFIIAGCLIFGTGVTYKFITYKTGTIVFRTAVALALGSVFLLIWVNGAVGIIGSETNEFNLLYSLVVLTGLIGLFLSGLKPRGLSYTMLAMAAIQSILMIVALINGLQETTNSSVFEIVLVNAFFIALYLMSATLFYRESKDGSIQVKMPE